MNRSAIINADDFGLSPGVNRGIIEAFREGVLTSTTMLINLDYFEDAVRLARENPDLPVGIHLSLLWGKPVTDPAEVPTLVERDGSFPRSLATLGARHLSGRLAREQVDLEFRNQIRTFLEAGLTPTHVDTHKHIHCLGGVLEALIAAARTYGIDRVRLPVERRSRAASDRPRAARVSWKASGKRRLLAFLLRGARERLRAAGMRTTDHFAGIEETGGLNSDGLNLILINLKGGITEIMCHPGYEDEPARRYGSVPLRREQELAGLKDPSVKDSIADHAIRLTHYGEL
jgi:hopanoid biosynthesis associated protein HpnK